MYCIVKWTLTIFLSDVQDIGISVEHIAVMYAVLPFTVFLAPPLIGFLADKLGSYTKVRTSSHRAYYAA